ncbi:MAG: DEAD/DEAH box helicase [Planctomycetes bacterium]|nr:DEAD/DEAH box helicase [Planctomycetota bacterium]
MRVLCRDAEWLVTRVDPSDYTGRHFAVRCVGADDLVRGHESIFLTQLDHIEPVDPRSTVLVADASSGYRLSKLFLEAQLRQMPATGVAPDLAGMGAFKQMNFQRIAVEWALRQLRPRLLLADAVGLGKTIELGMILVELLRRGRANRILVLARKSMLTQFQSELWNRFGIPLVRLDSEGIAKLRLRIPANKNPFEVYHRVIISIDTLKNVGRYQHFLENTRWDVVVIDEAHNVAGASVPERHLSHRLARLLSRKTDSMLLTTATPHNGKRETFGRLISLLDPSAIPDPKYREFTAEDIAGFFLMRFKEDVREEAGENLTERQLVPLAQTTVDASPAEEAVYAVLAEMRDAATTGKFTGDGGHAGRAHTLVQYGLYKLFLSSPEACRSTVQQRVGELKKKEPNSPEIAYLERLEKNLAGQTIANSSRYKLLKDQLRQIGWNGSANCPRVLIFTEYRRSQDALAEALAKDFKIKYSAKYEDQPGQVMATINGSCPDVHMMKTVEAFGTGSAPMRMLIATDVAAEGLNLHHECHNIVHFDLPWSIITLVQRNGRIDRFGQTKSPVLRYLRVATRQGLLNGDKEIFDRLVKKVEEINRARRQGESVLKLYDPEAEERYIAEAGILTGNVDVLEKSAVPPADEASDLEAILDKANIKVDEDFLRVLLGDAPAPEGPEAQPPADGQFQRLRLHSDRQFLLEGYRYLAELNRSYLPIEEAGKLLVLTAPKDLKRRLGAPDERGDVVFGATAIPTESWPENDQFRLTDDPEQVELAIKAARNMSGYWSRELLCAEQHPILQWITERLLMLMRRGEAPLITSRGLAQQELCFCFIGQVSSRAGSPLVVDAHAVSFRKGGDCQCRPLKEALDAAKFDRLVNAGDTPHREAAQALIPAAVEASLEHLRSLKQKHERDVLPTLRKEERRLRAWSERRRELLETRIEELGETHPMARHHRRELEQMDGYIKDRRENWWEMHVKTAPEPSTRLVLVIEGVK